MSLVPVIAMLIGLLVLGQVSGFVPAAGIICVVIAGTCVTRADARPAAAPMAPDTPAEAHPAPGSVMSEAAKAPDGGCHILAARDPPPSRHTAHDDQLCGYWWSRWRKASSIRAAAQVVRRRGPG